MRSGVRHEGLGDGGLDPFRILLRKALAVDRSRVVAGQRAAGPAEQRLEFATVVPDSWGPQMALFTMPWVREKRTKNRCLTGGRVNAETAERFGLVNRTVPQRTCSSKKEAGAQLVNIPAPAMELNRRGSGGQA